MAIAALAAVLLTAQVAAADNSAEARNRFSSGMRKYNVGKFTDAAADFEAAYELSGNDDLLFNAAQAWWGAKNYEKSLFFYKRYLASYRRRGAWPPDRALIEERIEEATRQVAMAREAPPPAPEKTPEKSAEPKAAEPAPPVASLPPSGSTVVPTPPVRGSGRPPRWQRPLGATLLGLGVAALAVGGAMGGLAHATANEVQAGHGEFDQTLYDKEQRGVRYQNAEVGLLVAGGALVVAGVVPLALSFRRPRAYAVVPALLPGGGGLALAGRF